MGVSNVDPWLQYGNVWGLLAECCSIKAQEYVEVGVATADAQLLDALATDMVTTTLNKKWV